MRMLLNRLIFVGKLIINFRQTYNKPFLEHVKWVMGMDQSMSIKEYSRDPSPISSAYLSWTLQSTFE